jgi:hypothetical protein
MINLEYLKTKLSEYNYTLQDSDEITVFVKGVSHRNYRDKMAFSVIFITLDEYAVTIEGMNEMLIRRAVEAGAIEVPNLEAFNMLKDIIYDTTTDTEIKTFESVFHFFEQQLATLETNDFDTKTYRTAIENLRLLVEAANAAPM